MTKRLAAAIKPRRITLGYSGRVFLTEMPMPKEKDGHASEGLSPTLLRKYSAECMKLARSTQTPKDRALFLEMGTIWKQLAQRLEENV
jgi:hypothetical protein